MYLRDGFPGQRLHVLPPPLVKDALLRRPTSRLLVTDAGYFPHASRHGRVRRSGSGQAIVILCVAGAGWCELDGVRHDVREGEVLLIPPREPHRYYSDADDPWSIWWLHVTGDDVADLLAAIGLTLARPTAPVTDPVQAAGLVEDVCAALARDETSASLTAAAGAAWHLLALLAADRHQRSVGDASINRVQAHLREHIADPFTVADLAARAGFSTSHFSARFHAVTGFSVTEYVKRLRMARARELLITTDDSVAEIAQEVGYPDQFYFSRQFRAVTGSSPRAFRSRVVEEMSLDG
ncbi:MAG: AraC family transcriptional regulator [Propionicimonas sp.]|uniref:AraC family transcriptional regulator n=1 Tax=Propionicimonas sp. TaxID=1955623 RepID=UPI003D118A89